MQNNNNQQRGQQNRRGRPNGPPRPNRPAANMPANLVVNVQQPQVVAQPNQPAQQDNAPRKGPVGKSQRGGKKAQSARQEFLNDWVISGDYQDSMHSHDVLATERRKGEELMIKEILAEDSHALILDIGGAATRHYRMQRQNVWSLMPMTSPADACRIAEARSSGALLWCECTWQQWDTARGGCCARSRQFFHGRPPYAIILVHSIYYFPPSEVMRMVHCARSPIPVRAMYHTFAHPKGKLAGGEAEYTRIGKGRVEMVVEGNNAPYQHSASDWLRTTNYISQGNNAMAWTEKARSGVPSDATIISSFVTAPVGLRPQLAADKESCLTYYGPFDLRERYGPADEARPLNPVWDRIPPTLARDMLDPTNWWSAGEYLLFGEFKSVPVPKRAVALTAVKCAGMVRDAKGYLTAMAHAKMALKEMNLSPDEFAESIPYVTALGFTRGSAAEDLAITYALAPWNTPMYLNSKYQGLYGWKQWLIEHWKLFLVLLLIAFFINWGFVGSCIVRMVQFCSWMVFGWMPMAEAAAEMTAHDTFRRMTHFYWFNEIQSVFWGFGSVALLHWLWRELPPRIRIWFVLHQHDWGVAWLVDCALGLAYVLDRALLKFAGRIRNPRIVQAAILTFQLLMNVLTVLFGPGPVDILNLFNFLLFIYYFYTYEIRRHPYAYRAMLKLWLTYALFLYIMWMIPRGQAAEDEIDNPEPVTWIEIVLRAFWQFLGFYRIITFSDTCMEGRKLEKLAPSARIRTDHADLGPCKPVVSLSLIAFSLGEPPYMARSCVHNELIALSNRALKAQIIATPHTWEKALAVFRRHPTYAWLAHHHDSPRISFEDWVKRFPPTKRDRLVRQYELSMAEPEGTSGLRDRFDAFIKREHVLKASFDPRLIQGTSDAYQVTTGPFVYWFSKQLQRAWSVKRTRDKIQLVYASGLTAEQMGEWYTECIFDGLRAPVEADASRFDAAVGKHALKTEWSVYEECGATKLEVRAMKVQDQTKGRTKNDVDYSIDYTRKSGTNNTACGNSLLNGIKTLYELSQSPYEDHARVLIMGDDMLCMTTERQAQWLTRNLPAMDREFGFKTECVSRAQPEFCSGLFWPVEGGKWVFATKPGRLLAKCFFLRRGYCYGREPQYTFAIAECLEHNCHFVPVAGAVMRRTADVLMGFKSAKKLAWERTLPERKAFERHIASADTLAFFCDRYGTTPNVVSEFEQLILTSDIGRNLESFGEPYAGLARIMRDVDTQ